MSNDIKEQMARVESLGERYIAAFNSFQLRNKEWNNMVALRVASVCNREQAWYEVYSTPDGKAAADLARIAEFDKVSVGVQYECAILKLRALLTLEGA